MLEKNKQDRLYTIEDLERILDKLPFQVWLKDEDGNYIYTNKMFADKLGLEKEEVLGKSDYDIHDYDFAKKCVETDNELLEINHDVYNEEHSVVDGHDLWHRVHKFILNNDENNTKLIGGTASEVSLGKSVQLKLEKNLLNYLNTNYENQEHDKEIILPILTDLKQIVNCKNIDILLYDESTKRFNFYLGENEKESKLKSGIYINQEIENELCSDDNDTKKYYELHDKIQHLIHSNFKIKHIELANKLFALVVLYYAEDTDNINYYDSYLNEILIKMGIIIKQIENKAQIQSVNREKDKLKEAIQLEEVKLEFLSNISHEFRTPINIILSIVQLLDFYNNNLTTALDYEKFKEYLNILKQNSYRLLRLVNNVIDTAKINTNFYDLKLRNYNIVSIIENITMSTVSYANDKNRNIIFDTDNEDIILACDQDKIERIMLNLISNAIKFSELNTDIEIQMNTDFELNRVYISVKNYGEKIDSYNKERIFGKFSQVDDSLSRRTEGSGLGLFLSRKFVEMHGGEIYLDDTDDGTQLTFYLPIKVVDDENISPSIINENNLVERYNIEFSDIY